MTSKPKILLLGKTPPPYMGPSIATKILLESSLSSNYRIIHQETKLNNNLNNIGKLNFFKPLILFKRYIGFITKCIIYRPDLVIIPISQSWTGFSKDAIFILIGSFFKGKILVHLRGSFFLTFYGQLSASKQKKIRSYLSRCAGAIVLGHNLRYIFEPFFSDKQIYVVPNGGKYNFVKSQRSRSTETHQVGLIYVGNLQPSKGILDVINSYVRIPKKLNAETSIQLTLNIIGKWRDKNTMEAVFDILNYFDFFQEATSNSQFIKTATNQMINFKSVLTGQSKLDVLMQSDIMIFPPREPEGQPWVIIEAMAAGLPIITTDQGAITESVINNVNGFIVEPNSPEAIAEKIEFLIDNPEIRNEMGKASRRLYEEKFTEEKMISKLIEVFNTVLNQKK